MSSAARPRRDPAPLVACTIARDLQGFDLLIEDMEVTLGEGWGDVTFDDAPGFLTRPDLSALKFVVIAVDAGDEADTARISALIRSAQALGIRVMLIAGQISPTALHHLLRLRPDEFLPYPLPGGALYEAILRLRSSPPAPSDTETDTAAATAATPPPPPDPVPAAGPARPGPRGAADHDGKIISVQGLAGGTGASTLAANLAWELALLGKPAPRVCLMDLDFQYGAVATYLDLPRRDAVLELLTDTAHPDSDALLAAMLPYRDRLQVLTAPSEMLPLDIISPDDLGRILDRARQTFDFVVLDMPKTVVAWTETVLTRAHLCLALMELDLRSAQNVLRLLRALRAEDLPQDRLRFVLNRAPKFTDIAARARIRRMAESLGITLAVQLPDGGPQVTQCNDHGQPLAMDAPRNPLRKDIQKLAKSLFDLTRATGAAQP